MIKFYAKAKCVYCIKLEQLLKELKLPYDKIYPNDNEIQSLKDKYKMKTFPMVFLGNELIGGFTDFEHLLMTNELEKKLKAHGIYLEDW